METWTCSMETWTCSSGDMDMQDGDMDMQHGDMDMLQGDMDMQDGDMDMQHGDMDMDQGILYIITGSRIRCTSYANSEPTAKYNKLAPRYKFSRSGSKTDSRKLIYLSLQGETGLIGFKGWCPFK